MAVRVTTAEVKGIIETAESDLSAYIDLANALLTKALPSSGHSEAYLKEIEKWLSAHFAAVGKVEEGRITQEKFGNSYSAWYGGTLGKFLESTRYGQQAIVLDTTGGLAALGRGGFAEFEVI